MKEHRQINIWNPYYEQEVQIDEEITDLISLLWHKFGFETINSCQNNFGCVWIEFVFLPDLESFLDTLALHRDEDQDLYDDIMEEWNYGTRPMDFSLVLDEEKEEVYQKGQPRILLPASVRFPRKDLSKVVKILEETSPDAVK